MISGITESLSKKKVGGAKGGGGADLHLGGPRGWHNNAGCTIKSVCVCGGGGGGAWCD